MPAPVFLRRRGHPAWQACRLRPASPVQAARAAAVFFALPGNPISSAVTFQLFAAPLLAALGEDSSALPRFALAQLKATEWRGKTGLMRFLPAWCDFGLEPEVRLIPWHGSGDIAAYARSNCFLVVPPEALAIPEGSFVRILLDLGYSETLFDAPFD